MFSEGKKKERRRVSTRPLLPDLLGSYQFTSVRYLGRVLGVFILLAARGEAGDVMEIVLCSKGHLSDDATRALSALSDSG